MRAALKKWKFRIVTLHNAPSLGIVKNNLEEDEETPYHFFDVGSVVSILDRDSAGNIYYCKQFSKDICQYVNRWDLILC